MAFMSSGLGKSGIIANPNGDKINEIKVRVEYPDISSFVTPTKLLLMKFPTKGLIILQSRSLTPVKKAKIVASILFGVILTSIDSTGKTVKATCKEFWTTS